MSVRYHSRLVARCLPADPAACPDSADVFPGGTELNNSETTSHPEPVALCAAPLAAWERIDAAGRNIFSLAAPPLPSELVGYGRSETAAEKRREPQSPGELHPWLLRAQHQELLVLCTLIVQSKIPGAFQNQSLDYARTLSRRWLVSRRPASVIGSFESLNGLSIVSTAWSRGSSNTIRWRKVFRCRCAIGLAWSSRTEVQLRSGSLFPKLSERSKFNPSNASSSEPPKLSRDGSLPSRASCVCLPSGRLRFSDRAAYKPSGRSESDRIYKLAWL